MHQTQNLPFVACEKTPVKYRDFASDPNSAMMAAFIVDRFWHLDMSQVELSGYFSDDSEKNILNVSLWEAGQIEQSVWFMDAPFDGHLDIRAKEHSIFDALGFDFLSEVEKRWLEMYGYPPGFPCGIECSVTGTTLGELSVSPLV